MGFCHAWGYDRLNREPAHTRHSNTLGAVTQE